MTEPRNPYEQSKHGINLDAYNAWNEGFAAAEADALRAENERMRALLNRALKQLGPRWGSRA